MFLWIEKNMVFIIHLLCTKNPVLFVMHKETDMKAYYSKSHMNFPSVAQGEPTAAIHAHSCLGTWRGFVKKFIAVQVTKLCDLGVDDNVCSVGWAQRGTHLAVGTNQGKVQVRRMPLSEMIR